MKNYIFILLAMLLSFQAKAQKTELKAIKKTIRTFAQAGDQNNADLLAEQLDANYRVLMNRLFGSDKVTVMDKQAYLEKIRSKEFGGDDRALKFEEIIINGNSASVRVKMTGRKMSFVSLISLVKDSDQQWKLVSDIPMVL